MQKMAIVIGQETRAGFNMKTWLDNGQEGSGLECWVRCCSCLGLQGSKTHVARDECLSCTEKLSLCRDLSSTLTGIHGVTPSTPARCCFTY